MGYGILWDLTRKEVARSHGGSIVSDPRHHDVGFHNGCFRGPSAAMSGAPHSFVIGSLGYSCSDSGQEFPQSIFNLHFPDDQGC